MKIEKTVKIEIVDNKWVVTTTVGTYTETKIFSVSHQAEAYILTQAELK